MAWSEPPFLAVLIIAMLVSLRQMTYTKVVLMTLLMSSLFFIRYVGPVFALALTIGSTLTNRKQLGIIKSTFVNSAGLALSFIPVWLWLLRNQRIDGTFTGARAPGGGSFIDPLKTLTATFGTWVVGKPFESLGRGLAALQAAPPRLLEPVAAGPDGALVTASLIGRISTQAHSAVRTRLCRSS